MASKNKTGIEKLEEYSYGMKQRRYDDLLDLFEQIELEHVSELQALEKRYKIDLREARDARDIAIKEASKLRNDVNLAKDLVHDFRSDIAIMLGISCDGMADDVQEAIDSELDKRLIPPGMEWPRFEDGEHVQVGDKIKAHNIGHTSNVTSIKFNEYDSFVYYKWGGRLDGANIDGKSVKRPEVLAADGLPIKVGETVYGIGREQDVYAVVSTRANDPQGRFSVECRDGTGEKCMVDPSQLTHTPPDTQERIDKDAIMDAGKYVAGHPEAAGLREPPGSLSAKQAMMADLLCRQRELDARTMGGDAS